MPTTPTVERRTPPPAVLEQEPRAPERGPEPPRSLKGKMNIVGPGLIIAATGVGAGDLVSSLAVVVLFAVLAVQKIADEV